MLVSGLAVGCGGADADPPALHFLATAEQIGPVAYRDPLGAVSPGGHFLAWTERDRVHVRPLDGGAVRVIGPGTSSIRYLTWSDDTKLAVHERVFDRSRQEWWEYDVITGRRTPLDREWSDGPSLDDLEMLAWEGFGDGVAGVTRDDDGWTVWALSPDASARVVRRDRARLSFPAWSPSGQLACLRATEAGQHLYYPCDADPQMIPDQEVYGPVAFADDGALYYAAPDSTGFLDTWEWRSGGRSVRRLTRFARDAYAPTVTSDGAVVVKSQDYRVFLATAPAEGGPSMPLTAFQSETPTWSWDGDRVAFTFGDWRHVTDDFHYPDIAQHIGVVPLTGSFPHTAPVDVVRRSHSEDQSMMWSPNGRWIVFHTHEDSDDVWLMRADGSGAPVQISQDGSETGWPRWSPDGRWILFPSYRRNERGARQAHLFLIGVNQETGTVTAPQTRVDLRGFPHDIVQGEWADEGTDIIFEAAEAIGRKSLWRVRRTGGAPTRIHTFASDQIHSGIGVSPDGRWVAYVDRASDGFYQIHRVPAAGGIPEVLTTDPTHKTQPAYAPVGGRVAFTVFDYRVHFWRVNP